MAPPEEGNVLSLLHIIYLARSGKGQHNRNLFDGMQLLNNLDKAIDKQKKVNR